VGVVDRRRAAHRLDSRGVELSETGPPYPTYYYRRRYTDRLPAGSPPPRTYPRWGIAADLFWLAVLGALIWASVWWFR
jgi:hypothetical protein